MKYAHMMLVIFLIVTVSGTVSAFIYQIQILRKWLPDQNTYQYVIGLSDWHDKLTEISTQQRSYIEELLQQLDTHKAKVIVEDLSSMGNGDQATCATFAINTRGGILGGLAQDCHKLGFDVENIEYRHCRVASISPVLQKVDGDLSSFASTRVISVDMVRQEVIEAMNQIAALEDNNQVAKECKKYVHEIESHMKRLHWDRHAKESIAQYLDMHAKKNQRMPLLKDLLTFDSWLLDAKIVLGVLNATDKQTVFVIAGGTHVVQAAQLLEQLGYEVQFKSEVTGVKEYDKQKCIGSNIIDDTFCMWPNPANLNQVEALLNTPL